MGNLKKSKLREPLVRVLLNFLAHKEGRVQSLALECLTKVGYPYLHIYTETLLKICAEDGFKEEVICFSVADDAGTTERAVGSSEKGKKTDEQIMRGCTLEAQHRDHILPLLIRILLSKLFKKKGKDSKRNLHSKRNLVYQFFSSLSARELALFFEELFRSHRLDVPQSVASHTDQLLSKESISNSSKG